MCVCVPVHVHVTTSPLVCGVYGHYAHKLSWCVQQVWSQTAWRSWALKKSRSISKPRLSWWQKKEAMSVLWQYFGFSYRNIKQKNVLYKTCKVPTSCCETTNLKQNLRQHREKYKEYMWVKTQPSKDKDKDNKKTESHQTSQKKNMQNSCTQSYSCGISNYKSEDWVQECCCHDAC